MIRSLQWPPWGLCTSRWCPFCQGPRATSVEVEVKNKVNKQLRTQSISDLQHPSPFPHFVTPYCFTVIITMVSCLLQTVLVLRLGLINCLRVWCMYLSPTLSPLLLLYPADPHELGPAQGFFLLTQCFPQAFCKVFEECRRCYSETISVLPKKSQVVDDNYVLMPSWFLAPLLTALVAITLPQQYCYPYKYKSVSTAVIVLNSCDQNGFSQAVCPKQLNRIRPSAHYS